MWSVHLARSSLISWDMGSTPWTNMSVQFSTCLNWEWKLSFSGQDTSLVFKYPEVLEHLDLVSAFILSCIQMLIMDEPSSDADEPIPTHKCLWRINECLGWSKHTLLLCLCDSTYLWNRFKSTCHHVTICSQYSEHVCLGRWKYWN